jgi:hypothetical protein
MNKSPVLIETLPKIIYHNSKNIQKQKTYTFQANKKIFNIKTKIKEDKNRVMIDSYVEWYDVKKERMRKKRFLQVYDCDDQDLETLF